MSCSCPAPNTAAQHMSTAFSKTQDVAPSATSTPVSSQANANPPAHSKGSQLLCLAQALSLHNWIIDNCTDWNCYAGWLNERTKTTEWCSATTRVARNLATGMETDFLNSSCTGTAWRAFLSWAYYKLYNQLNKRTWLWFYLQALAEPQTLEKKRIFHISVTWDTT